MYMFIVSSNRDYVHYAASSTHLFADVLYVWQVCVEFIITVTVVMTTERLSEYWIALAMVLSDFMHEQRKPSCSR